MHKLLAGLALLLGVLGTQVATAQDGTITGVVTDAQSDEPLPGANVFIQELGIGAATSPEGRYTIAQVVPRPEPYLVRASFAGYTTRQELVTVTPGATVTVNFELHPGVELEGIVVTALGIEREARSLGYATQRVGGELLERANESNLVNALAGKAAGVQVTSAGGQPGEAARIVIRGNSSFLGDNTPLFVIDGVPISNEEHVNPDGGAAATSSMLFRGGTSNRALDLDPNIIEDIQILKGAAAMALYGSRAAHGAVLITTRGARAHAARPQVTFSSNFRWDDAIIQGYQTQYHLGTLGCFMNGMPAGGGAVVDEECFQKELGFVPSSGQATVNWGPSIEEANQNQALLDALGVDQIPVFDPRRDFYQTGATSEYSVSVQGSVAGANVFASAARLDQEGVVPGTSLERTSLMARFGAQPAEGLNLEAMVNYINTRNQRANQGNGVFSYQFGMLTAPITFNIDQRLDDGRFANRMHSGAFNNPLWLSENNMFSSGLDRYIASLGVTYQILPWLRASERLGIDSYTDTRKGGMEIGTRGTAGQTGRMFDQYLNRREINSDLILQTTRQDVGPVGLDFLLGNNINHRVMAYSFQQGIGLNIPNFFHISNANVVNPDESGWERAVVGIYGQATMDYEDWAYLTLTGRNDWSSTLPAGNRSYFYPSVGLAVVFTDALGDFFQNVPVLDFGKVRASIARIGNDADPFQLRTTFLQANLDDAVRGAINFPFSGTNAYRESVTLANPDLRPELSTEYEVGLELQFAANMVRMDASYYNRTTTDQIFIVPISGTTGFTGRVMNAGDLRNRGVELAVGFTPISTRDFRWNIDANWSRNRADVVELAEGVENIFLFGFDDPQIRIMEGKDGYGVIWSNRYLRADREAHADLFAAHPELQEGMLLIGQDGLPLLAPGLGPIGNVQPDWLANLRSSVSFRGLTLSGLLDIRQGGDVLNFDLWYSTFYGTAGVTADRGSEYVFEGFNVDTGELNDVTIIRDQNFYQGHYGNVIENFVEDGSFVKLRELSLGYTVPTEIMQRARAQSATITLTGRNLWTRTDFSYGDPEGGLGGSGNAQGFYHAVTPGTRSFSLGLRLGF